MFLSDLLYKTPPTESLNEQDVLLKTILSLKRAAGEGIGVELRPEQVQALAKYWHAKS